MPINISNKLTDLGARYFFESLFDKDLTYSKLFFEDPNTLLKLKLYEASESSFIESSSESIEIVDDKLVLTYGFEGSDIESFNLNSIKLSNDSGDIVVVDEVEISNLNSQSKYNKLKSVRLEFEISQISPCITKNSYNLILQVLANQSDLKISKLYLGTGPPDLSGNSHNLTNKIMQYDIEDYEIIRKKMLINIKDYQSDVTNNSITELGLGYDTSESDYFLLIMYPVDFENIQSNSNVIITTVLELS